MTNLYIVEFREKFVRGYPGDSGMGGNTPQEPESWVEGDVEDIESWLTQTLEKVREEAHSAGMREKRKLQEELGDTYEDGVKDGMEAERSLLPYVLENAECARMNERNRILSLPALQEEKLLEPPEDYLNSEKYFRNNLRNTIIKEIGL